MWRHKSIILVPPCPRKSSLGLGNLMKKDRNDVQRFANTTKNGSSLSLPKSVNCKYFLSFKKIFFTFQTQYAVDQGLAGAMVWSIETDDFLGLCHGEKYPMLKMINRVLHGHEVTYPPTAPPPTTPTAGTGPTEWVKLDLPD